MSQRISKSAQDAPILGPPRNSMLWLRAKEMASAMGQAGQFQTILQMYQMLILAPGFLAVSKSAASKGGRSGSLRTAAQTAYRHFPQSLDEDIKPVLKARRIVGSRGACHVSPRFTCKKANFGRKKPNGRREGLFSWAHAEAKRRGKPKAYALAIARKIMAKGIAHLIAGQRLNESTTWDRSVAASGGPDVELRPTRQVSAIGDVLQGLPLSAHDSDRLGLDLSEVLEQAQTPADAMQQAMMACRAHPQLAGDMQVEIGKRMAYLQSFFRF